MQKLEMENGVQILLKRARFEYVMAVSNLTFMLRHAIENNDNEFLKSDSFRDLEIAMNVKRESFNVMMSCVLLALTGHTMSELDYEFSNDYYVLEYEVKDND